MDKDAMAHSIQLLEKQVDQLTAERDQAYAEAKSLATILHQREFKDESPAFELCDSTAGVISQIDNMIAGISAERDELKDDAYAAHRAYDDTMAENILLREALVKLCPAEHSDNCKWNNETSCHCGWFDAEQALNSTPRTAAVSKVLEAAIDDLSEGCDCQVCEAVREMEDANGGQR